MALHNEIQFELDICNHLAANGWLYGAPGSDGDASGYDTPRALFPADLLSWIQATQPAAWDALSKTHGASAEAMLLDQQRLDMWREWDRRLPGNPFVTRQLREIRPAFSLL